jgi:hypothetical protein
LKPNVLEHGHNMHEHHPGITILKTWKDIFEHVTQ